MATKRPASAVWGYFTVIREREAVAKCNICGAEIRRGAAGAKSRDFSTKSLWGHLKARHKDEHSLAEEKQTEEVTKKMKKRKMEENWNKYYVLEEKPSTSKQLTLENIFNIGDKWNTKQSEQAEGEQLLTYWLCDALKSCETVENEQFHRFISHLSKQFKVPSKNQIQTNLIPELDKKVQYAVKLSLDTYSIKDRSYSITTDIWTFPSKYSFMSITAHWISEDFQRKLAVLRCILYNTAHSASNLSSALQNVCSDWGVTNVHVIVRDNASNIVLGAKNAGYQSIGCFCHILHLVVNHFVLEQSEVKLMISR